MIFDTSIEALCIGVGDLNKPHCQIPQVSELYVPFVDLHLDLVQILHTVPNL